MIGDPFASLILKKIIFVTFGDNTKGKVNRHGIIGNDTSSLIEMFY